MAARAARLWQHVAEQQRPEHAYKGVDSMFGHAYCISHVKEGETNEKGKSVHVDLARTFGFAKAHGYKGYFSMEFDSRGDPYACTKRLIEKPVRSPSSLSL